MTDASHGLLPSGMSAWRAGRDGVSSRYRLTAVTAAAAGALWLLDLYPLLGVMAVVLTSVALPGSIPMGLRLLFSLPLLASWVMFLTAVLQPFGLGLEPGLTLVSACLVALPWARVRQPRHEWDLPSSSVLAAGAAVALFLVSAGFVGTTIGPGPAQRVGLFAATEDGASHLTIYGEALEHEGFLYGADARLDTAWWIYPHGFHLNAAFVERAIERTAGVSPGAVIRFDAYWLSAIAGFALLAAGAAAAAFVTAWRLGVSGPLTATAAIGAGAATLVGPAFHMFQHGFHSQVAALSLLTLAIAAAMLPPDRVPFRTHALLVAVPCALSTYGWYFLAPVFVAVGVAWVIARAADARRHWLFTATLAGLSVAAAAIPVLFARGVVTARTINTGGGVTPVPLPEAVALVVVTLIALFVAWRSGQGRAALVPAGVLLVSTAFAVGLRQYQLATAGSTAYFYDKSVYTTLIVATSLAFAGGVYLLTRLSRQRTTRRAATVRGAGAIVGTAFATIVLAFAATRVSDQASVIDWRAGRGINAAWQPAHQYFQKTDLLEGRQVLAWDATGEPIPDYLASRWLSALSGGWNPELHGFMGRQLGPHGPADLAAYANEHPGEVAAITRDPHLRDKLTKAGLRPSADLLLLPVPSP